MNKKIWIGLGVLTVFIVILISVAVVFLSRARQPASAANLFPKDTIYFCESRSPLKIKAALAALDLNQMLQDSIGLTEAESQAVDKWAKGLQGAHIGFQSFTLVPFVLNASIILDGMFDCPLTDILDTANQKRFQPEESYRGVASKKAVIPFKSVLSVEIYITEPAKNRTVITFSRRSLTETIDRMLDGGPSLSDNPSFQELNLLKAIRNADVVEYMDVQAFLRMLREWCNLVPQPQLKALIDTVWKELRLDDFKRSVSGHRFDKDVSHSFIQINPDSPLYQQFKNGGALAFPYVPSNSYQFIFYRLSKPAEALRQAKDTVLNLVKALPSARVTTQHFQDLLEDLGASSSNAVALETFLSGDIGLWKAADDRTTNAVCFYIGIKDAELAQKWIGSVLKVRITETNGICTASGLNPFYWSVQPKGVLISKNPDYLRTSLATNGTSLTDTLAFREFSKKLPREYSAIKYSTYENFFPIGNDKKLPAAFRAVLDLLKGYRQMGVSYAEDGMLVSQSVQRFNAKPPAVFAAVRMIASTNWISELSSKSSRGGTNTLRKTTGRQLSVDEKMNSIRKVAESGDADAQVTLGDLYQAGAGGTKNYEESVKWYRMAADQRNVRALCRLAACYTSGKGVEKDLVKAVSLFKDASKLGSNDAVALNDYAWFLATCENLDFRNYPEAVRLAEQSVSIKEATFNLDTLATAYAAAGQYDEAVKTQKRLIELQRKTNPGKEVPPWMLKPLTVYEQKAKGQALGTVVP